MTLEVIETSNTVMIVGSILSAVMMKKDDLMKNDPKWSHAAFVDPLQDPDDNWIVYGKIIKQSIDIV